MISRLSGSPIYTWSISGRRKRMICSNQQKARTPVFSSKNLSIIPTITPSNDQDYPSNLTSLLNYQIHIL